MKHARKNDELSRLQDWYRSHCDGDWEHLIGVRISSLDNPGWSVDINLEDTELEGKPFTPRKLDRTEIDWIYCKVENATFKANGGVGNLREMLRIFLDWANGK